MYDWVPFAADADKRLAYKCEWGIGLAGDGNTDPPITMTMHPSFEDQKLETYYPWRSMSEHGKQALAAVHIAVNGQCAAFNLQFTFLDRSSLSLRTGRRN